MNKTILVGADLTNTNLVSAEMEAADLQGAQIINADLYKANLQNANLNAANLQSKHLLHCNLKGARYCSKARIAHELTIFPKEFNPEEHGMIEANQISEAIRQFESDL